MRQFATHGLMVEGHARGRRVFWLALALAGTLFAVRPSALALDPSLDISQYAHTTWRVRDGFAKGTITSIAQTPDGYLWLGTPFGLLRLDGVRNEPWQPESDQQLPSPHIFSLLAAHDGTLWIGTAKGLASWKDGKLTQYAELAGRYIFALAEDRDGSIWASGLAVTTGRLCAIRHGSVQCDGDDGSLGRGAFNIYEDGKGNLWAGVKNGLWKWRPGPPKFFPLPGEPDGIQALGEDADGTLLVGWNGGIQRFVDGRTEPYSLGGASHSFRARRIFRDRDGGLWVPTFSGGLLHVHQGRTDVFSQEDGLSGDNVFAVFEDQEGNIWTSTTDGLDRFRAFAIATFTTKQGLPARVVSVLAARDGSLWLSTNSGVDRWTNVQISSHRISRGILNDLPGSLFEDDRGRVWTSRYSQVGYFEKSRFSSMPAIPGGNVLSIVQDRDRNLWFANESLGLFRLSPKKEVRKLSWAELGHNDHASVLAPDESHGGLWIGFFGGGVAYLADGQIRSSYPVAGSGRVSGFQFDRDGTLWVSSEGGLSRLKNGRMATLTSKNGLPCDSAQWVAEDDAHSIWLYMTCGLVRIPRVELDAWATTIDEAKNTGRAINVQVFDSFDGERSQTSTGFHFSPQVAMSEDGRLWFLPGDGVSVIDSGHIPFNKVPPPVHIEKITADGNTFDASRQLRLPPRIRDLTIDYTALSFVAPEKIHFRFKLEGQDPGWREVVNDREVQYSNLPPKHYRFRVLASNNSGVWNEEGARLDFVIPPMWYQTNWFRALCTIAFLGLLWMVYQLRVSQLHQKFALVVDARVNERTRIARELHDTMLQSFQGVLMKLHALTYILPDLPEAQQTLKKVINDARQAIAEGRDAVQGLRSSTLVTNDVAEALNLLGKELAAQSDGNRPEFSVDILGTPRDLIPLLRDEVCRITSEALRNAFRHAHARRIEVEIRYDQRQLRLRVRDDGKGIDSEVLKAGGRVGHYGLPSMHERAKLIGGKLAVWSELDSGTETELTIPASIAYAKSEAGRRLKFWRKGA